MNGLDRSRIEGALAAAVQYSGADEVFAVLSSTTGETTRIADGIVASPHAATEAGMQITLRKGNRYGSIHTNELQPDGVRRAMDIAVAQSAIMPEVEQIVPFPSSIEFVEAASTHASSRTSLDGSELLKRLSERVESAAIRLTGSLALSHNTLSIASSNGLFLHHPSSFVHTQFRLYSNDGWSTGYSERFDDALSEEEVIASLDGAVQKCRAWRDPVEIQPGRHTVVLEPRALADMLKPMMEQFSSRAVEEGRSFLRKLDGSNFVGSRLFDEQITLRSDPRNKDCASLPFTMDGTPVPSATWVQGGVIEQLVLDRYESAASGGLPVPPPTNLIMEGGASTMEELVSSIDRGLLVTGFSGLQVIDPSNCLLTGSTRDGLFLIEEGRISKAVRNIILRETPVYLMKEVEALGAVERTSTTGSFFPMLLPAMRVKDVLFGGSSGMI